MKEKIPCPICRGTGNILREKRNNVILNEKQTKELFAMYRNGETLRKIASHFGFKHPQSVAHFIKSRMKAE